MAETDRSSDIVIIASCLGMVICLPGIVWRIFFAIQLKYIPDAVLKNPFVGAVVSFLILGLVINIVFLISSFVLYLYRNKGKKALMWLWITETWIGITLDSVNLAVVMYNSFFMFTVDSLPNNLMKSSTNSLAREKQITGTILAILSVAPFYLLLLLIHVLLAYLTIKLGCYAISLSPSNSDGTLNSSTQGRILHPTEGLQLTESNYPEQIPRRRSITSDQMYQYGVYRKSEDDINIRYGYGDNSVPFRRLPQDGDNSVPFRRLPQDGDNSVPFRRLPQDLPPVYNNDRRDYPQPVGNYRY